MIGSDWRYRVREVIGCIKVRLTLDWRCHLYKARFGTGSRPLLTHAANHCLGILKMQAALQVEKVYGSRLQTTQCFF